MDVDGSPGQLVRGGDKVIHALVIVSIILSAFTDMLPFLPIGELSSEGFVWVLPVLFGYIFFFYFSKIALPVNYTFIIVALFLVVFLGCVVNFPEISAAHFKGRSGMGRVITQSIALTFGIIVLLLFYNIVLQGYQQSIARGALYAIMVMTGVGFFEFASWFNIPGLTQIHEIIQLLIHASGDYVQRLRMTGFEVSWTSVVLTFLFPFAIADERLSYKQIAGLTALVVVLIILTQSRTALLVLFAQISLMSVYYLRNRLDVYVYGALAVCFAVTLLMLIPGANESATRALRNVIEYGNFAGNINNLEENNSNVTRLAAIRAGLSMFFDHPIFGVGIGQYGFEYPLHILASDLRSYEVEYYIEEWREVWPPSYSLHVRILAELGLAGLVVWIAMILPIFIKAARNVGVTTEFGKFNLAIVMTIAGWMCLGFSIDSFRFVGGWITLGVALGLQQQNFLRFARPKPKGWRLWRFGRKVVH